MGNPEIVLINNYKLLQRLISQINNTLVYGEYFMKTSKEIRNLVIAMLFGDGTLNARGYLSMRHCIAQKDYIDWKRKLLVSGISMTDCYYVSNNGYGAYEVRSRVYKFMKHYRKVIYGSGRKNITDRRILNKLTPLGLSIWYMDDGGLSQKKNKDGEVVANELMLNTHLSREDNQKIIDYFNEVWSIKFTQVKNRGLYRLRCGTAEARKFIEIVKPYVSQVPSMAHKMKLKVK